MGLAQQVAKGLAGDREARNDERGGSKSLLQRLASRQSNEIVIAFAGPIGCGLDEVVEATHRSLIGMGYEVLRIKLSECLDAALDAGHLSIHVHEGSPAFVRYRRLQDAALRLREDAQDHHILAEYAIQRIVVHRAADIGPRAEGTVLSQSVPRRTAYLLDQLKRPEEVELLRAMYRNLFYFVGVTRPFSRRLRALEVLGITQAEAERLVTSWRQGATTYLLPAGAAP